MTFRRQISKIFPQIKQAKKFQKNASAHRILIITISLKRFLMRHARRVECARNLQEFSTKKLSPYPCGQVVSKFTLQGLSKTRFLVFNNFFQCLEYQYSINFSHIIFTLKLKAKFLTGPVLNPNYKAKTTLLNLGISTKLQPNYFNSNVTIFSNSGFMSSFLKKRLSHMVVNSLWIKSLPPLQQWVQKAQRPITGIRYLSN